MSVAALIVAAGRGSRAGEGPLKQYRSLAGKPVLARTLEAFLRHPRIEKTLVVIHPEDGDLYDQCVTALPGELAGRLLRVAHGGETRQESVRNGLEALAEFAPRHVLI